jgi:hypothetical protein
MEAIKKKIELLKSGQLSEHEFLKYIEHFPYKDMGDIKLDFHRPLRRGLPEAIYGSGKTVDHLAKIVKRFHEMDEDILITRIEPGKFKNLAGVCPDIKLYYHEKAGIVTFTNKPKIKYQGTILVISAGSSD